MQISTLWESSTAPHAMENVMKIEFPLLLPIPQNPALQSVMLKRNIGAWWMLVQCCIVHPPLDYFAHASLVKKCDVETLVRLWRERWAVSHLFTFDCCLDTRIGRWLMNYFAFSEVIHNPPLSNKKNDGEDGYWNFLEITFKAQSWPNTDNALFCPSFLMHLCII